MERRIKIRLPKKLFAQRTLFVSSSAKFLSHIYCPTKRWVLRKSLPLRGGF